MQDAEVYDVSTAELRQELRRRVSAHLKRRAMYEVPVIPGDRYAATANIDDEQYEKINARRNNFKVNAFEKILNNNDVKTARGIMRRIKIMYVPPHLQARYSEVMYGIPPPVARINRSEPAQYDNDEDMSDAAIEAYYEKLDAKDGQWLKLGIISKGVFLMPSYGVRSNYACGEFGVVGCTGSGTFNRRNGTDEYVENRIDDYSDQAHIISGKMAGKVCLQSCNKHRCPICYKRGIQKSATAIADRVFGAIHRQKTDKSGMVARVPLHSVVSLPRDMYEDFRDSEKREEFLKMMRQELKDLNIEGGVTITHPFRFTRGLNAPYWSPHIHLIITGFTHAKQIAEFSKRTRLIFRTFSILETYGDVKRCAAYLLSHAGIEHGHHTVRWFGAMQNKEFKTADIQGNMNRYNDQPILSIPSIKKIVDRDNIEKIELQLFRPAAPIESKYDYVFKQVEKSKILTFNTKQDFLRFAAEYKISDADMMMIAAAGQNKQLDNAPTAKSAEQSTPGFMLPVNGSYLLSVRVTICNIEKCKILTVYIDHDQGNLCPICCSNMSPVIPLNGVLAPYLISAFNDITEPDQFEEDLDKWRFVDNDDLSQGLPYFDAEGIMQRVTGAAIKSLDYFNLDVNIRHEQHTAYLQSLVRLAMKRIKNEQWVNFNSDPYWRKHYRSRSAVLLGFISRMDKPSIIDGHWPPGIWSALESLYLSVNTMVIPPLATGQTTLKGYY